MCVCVLQKMNVEEIEAKTARGELEGARTLVSRLSQECTSVFIEVALGQYQLAVRRGVDRWINDFRIACEIHLTREEIERNFPAPGGSSRVAEAVERVQAPSELERQLYGLSEGASSRPVAPVRPLTGASGGERESGRSRSRGSRSRRSKSRSRSSRSRRERSRSRERGGWQRVERRGRRRSGSRDTQRHKRTRHESPQWREVRRDDNICAVCQERVRGSLEEHAFDQHLPAMMRLGGRPNLNRQLDRREALQRLSFLITGQPTAWRLVDRWNKLGITLGSETLRHHQPELQDLCQVAGWTVPGEVRAQYMNSPAGLMDWRVLCFLLAQLPPQQRTDWRLRSTRPGHYRSRQRWAPQRGRGKPATVASRDAGPQGSRRSGWATTVARADAIAEKERQKQAAETAGSTPPREEGETVRENQAQESTVQDNAPQDVEMEDNVLELDVNTEVASPVPAEKEEELLGEPEGAQAMPPVRQGEPVGALDGHFHISRAARGAGWEETLVGQMESVETQKPVRMLGGVAVFCDAEDLPRLEGFLRRDDAGEWEMYYAVGLHPKKAGKLGQVDVASMQHLLRLPQVHALGEIGLDFTVPRKEWERQEDALRMLIRRLCTTDKVLVLHLRGEGSDRHHNRALERGLAILKEEEVRPEQRMHLHCFGGDVDQVREWSKAFKNCHFGFSAITYSFDREQRQALTSVSLNKIILETDSPYLTPPSREGRNCPGLIGEVAATVAESKTVDWAELVQVSNRNIRRLYRGLPEESE